MLRLIKLQVYQLYLYVYVFVRTSDGSVLHDISSSYKWHGRLYLAAIIYVKYDCKSSEISRARIL